jgi:hypothetical protein
MSVAVTSLLIDKLPPLSQACLQYAFYSFQHISYLIESNFYCISVIVHYVSVLIL